MNERTAPPPNPDKAPAAPKAGRPAAPVSPVKGSDREFLPAALEILETPPSPLPVALMLTICAFIAAALVWSFFGRLDVHAVAPGRIETASRAKIVQPFDNGKVAAIHIENGATVKVGQPLLELDPAEAQADANTARDAMDSNSAEIARRAYAVRAARSIPRELDGAKALESGLESVALSSAISEAEAKIDFAPTTPADDRLRERSVLTADLNQLGDTLVNLDKQIAQKEATRQRLDMSIGFQNVLMETLTDRVGTRQRAIELQVGTKINLYDAKEELEKSQSQLASDQGQKIETEAALNELRSQKAKSVSQFIADNENKAADAARKLNDARQSLAKAAAKLERTKLVAPIDGVIQQLAVTTIGQVVTTGQQLAMVTPSEGALQVDVLVANLDIGFIKPGQDVVVKVDAFPFTRFGALKGKVKRIATQAISEAEAKRAMADVTAPNNNNPASNSAPGQPDSFVFPVTVTLDQSTMRIGDVDIPLTSGMTVSAEIKTDSRRVIDYLLSPLSKVGSEALRER